MVTIYHFSSREFISCISLQALISEQLNESGGMCEYALYVRGMVVGFHNVLP